MLFQFYPILLLRSLARPCAGVSSDATPHVILAGRSCVEETSWPRFFFFVLFCFYFFFFGVTNVFP